MKRIKHTAALFSVLKSVDLLLQVVACCLMILNFHRWSFPGMFLVAAVQYGLTILWLPAAIRVPQLRARKYVQAVFLALGTALLLSWFGTGALLRAALLPLIVAGPLLGGWYFIVTAREIHFYRQYSRQTFN